jgi:nucleotide-binding universal stress UspA family protein
MKKYGKVLVAIDLGEYSEDLIERALAVTESPSAVHLVFVHQRVETVYDGVGPMGSALAKFGAIEDRLRNELDGRLKGWAEAYDIPEENTHFLVGKPASKILEFARANEVELIVIATHSRKGLQRLLGSTAHEVLQDVKRDVLAIHAD